MSDGRLDDSAAAAGGWATREVRFVPVMAALATILLMLSRTLRSRRAAIPALALCAIISGCPDNTTNPIHDGREITAIPTATRFLHGDAEGAVRSETNRNGTVVAGSVYDAFGSVVSKVGSSSAHGTFQRNEFDSVGIANFRARPYDPSTGLFLAPDPISQAAPEAIASNPIELNLYLYVGGTVPNSQDPSGLCLGPVGLLCAAAAALGEVGVTITVGDLVAGVFSGTALTAAFNAHHIRDWTVRRAQRISRRLAREGTVRILFATYTMQLIDGSTYSGRTSTRVRSGESDRDAAERAVDQRNGNHHMASGAATAAVLDTYVASTVRFDQPSNLARDILALGQAYLAIRGREQMLINHHGGARSMVDAAGRVGSSGNAINGIALTNEIYHPAIAAAVAQWPHDIKWPTFTPMRRR